MTEKSTAATAAAAVSAQAKQLRELIGRGKEQGYLTYAEVNDHLPNGIVDPEQIEDIVNTINDMGITVYEKAPDAEALLLTDAAAPDEEAVEEAAAALAIGLGAARILFVSDVPGVLVEGSVSAELAVIVDRFRS